MSRSTSPRLRRTVGAESKRNKRDNRRGWDVSDEIATCACCGRVAAKAISLLGGAPERSESDEQVAVVGE